MKYLYFLFLGLSSCVTSNQCEKENNLAYEQGYIRGKTERAIEVLFLINEYEIMKKRCGE